MNKLIGISIFFVLIFPGSVIYAQETQKNMTVKQLKNGLNLVLIENHSLPMIASVVTVNAGSTNESREINGISHMLEHLLFNGTDSRTQKQLYHDQDYYGIYNNAHTGREYTNYIVLAEKGFIEKALDIQSDMLFRSIFPEDKFEKEKGIILNELARDSADDSYWVTDFFNRKFYNGTPYNLTVLGTPSSIKKIKREQVIKYYQTYYKPNNMTALVMGSFDPDQMTELFEKYFGSVSPGKIPEPENYKFNIADGKTYIQKIKSNNIYLNLGLAAPNIGNKDFYAFDLLNRIFDLHLKDDLNDRLKKKNRSQILEIFSSFDFSKSLSSFTITAVLPPDSDAEIVKKELSIYLKEFISRKFEKGETKMLLTSLNVSEQFLFEKPHYYGMMKGPWIAAGGWKFTNNYLEQLAKVTAEELKRVGEKYFTNPQFLASITVPGDKKPEFAMEEYFALEIKKIKFTPESIVLTELWKKEDHRKNKIKKNKLLSGKQNLIVSETKRRVEKTVLKNGLTLLINSNPDSRVFAIHLLAKNRTALEPFGKEGIADFLHRMIEKRTGTRNKKQLTDSLKSIGAVLKTKDSTYIPYDDYYTSRKFSFIRFETIDSFYKEAINIFSDIVRKPSFLEEDMNEVKREMISLIRKNNVNPSKLARNILYEKLFNKNPFSRRINGTEESISSITQKDLIKFYETYFAPNNLIISVATSVDRKVILKEFENYFAKDLFKKTPPLVSAKHPVFSKSESIKFPLNKTQSHFRLGTLFKMNPDDEAGFRVLAAILSHRLAQNLREKKGLSYSLGANFSIHNSYGLFQIIVGTKRETLSEVEQEVYLEIENIKKERIAAEELNMLINYSNSRRLMRSLSRISQCYQNGLSEFYGKPFNYNEKLLQEIKKIHSEKILELAGKYLKRENMVKIIIE